MYGDQNLTQQLITPKQNSIFKEIFYCLFEKERALAQAGRGTEGKGEADPPLSREPNLGLDPRIPGWKADA